MDHVEYMRLLRSGPIEKELPFTQEEYDERVAKVRAELGKDGLDGLIVVSPANLHYLSGYYTVFDLQPDGSRDSGGRGTGRGDGVVRNTSGNPVGVGWRMWSALHGTKAI